MLHSLLIFLSMFCLPFATLSHYPKPEIKQNTKETALSIKETRIRRPAIVTRPNDFLQLVTESNVFVDKSILIKELLENPAQVISLTRPPHWGKTVNIDMIKRFLELKTDSKGNTIPFSESSTNYRLFFKGEVTSKDGKTEKLQAPLLIAKHQDLFDKYFGKYPVLYMDFGKFEADSFEDFIGAFMARIGEAYSRYQYLADSYRAILHNPNITKPSKIHATNQLRLFYGYQMEDCTIHPQLMLFSIRYLTQLLYEYFKTPICLLIDEFDAPSNAIFESLKYNQSDKRRTLNFYTDFLKITFLNNTNLHKGIMTGVMPFSFEQLDSGLNVITEYTFFNGELMEYYGISEWELNKIFQQLNVPPNQKKLDFFTEYYKYPFKNFQITMHNPLSVALFLATRKTIEWLNISWMDKLTNFFLSYHTVDYHPHLYTLLSEYGAAVPKKNLQDGRFGWDELDILHKSVRLEYKAEWYKEQMEQFDNEKFVDKAILFLYTYGFLAFANIIESLPEDHICIRFPYNFTGYRIADIHVTYSQVQVLKNFEDPEVDGAEFVQTTAP